MERVKLSPSSLDLFLECKLCFWLDKKAGVRHPVPFSYSLNVSLDELLEEEFDSYRQKDMLPPFVEQKNIKARLFSNQKLLNKWRDTKEGLKYYDKTVKAELFGVIDDIFEFNDGSLAVLDYKATYENIAKIYDRFQLQLDSYTFLLEKNGYKTKKKAYLAFYAIDKSRGFIDRLPFQKKIIEVKTNPSEVEEIFRDAVHCLKEDAPSGHSHDCPFGKWLTKAKNFMV